MKLLICRGSFGAPCPGLPLPAALGGTRRCLGCNFSISPIMKTKLLPCWKEQRGNLGGDEEQTVQTLMDAVILSALLPGVSCAEQLLAEPFLLSCLLSRPSDLSPFLSHFLPVLISPAGPMFPALHFLILTSYLHISLALQDREHPPDLP